MISKGCMGFELLIVYAQRWVGHVSVSDGYLGLMNEKLVLGSLGSGREPPCHLLYKGCVAD